MYYGEIINGVKKEKHIMDEHKVNEGKIDFSEGLLRELNYELNYKVDDISRYNAKDYYYIVIKVKIDAEKKEG